MSLLATMLSLVKLNPLLLAPVSVLPFIELRGGIPLGIAAGLDPVFVFIICVASNIVLIPILLMLLNFFFEDVLFKFPRVGKKMEKTMDRVHKKTKPFVDKYGVIGLALFVAIPLPVTGAWTGCLAAYLLEMEKTKAIASIAIGVFIAGILVTLASVGVLNLVV